MSRIGNSPITIPEGVTVDIGAEAVKVTGPKGELTTPLMNKNVKLEMKDGVVTVSRANEDKSTKAYHGLIRSLVNNMIIGVTEGYKKTLEVEGVGFKVNLAGKTLKMSLGFSHEVVFEAPEGIDLKVDGMTITVEGIDKQLVGQTAAQIREFKKPEPYKGKGIRYEDEYIIRKAGKTAGAGAE
jgi:large subunit ribosomal protein L6